MVIYKYSASRDFIPNGTPTVFGNIMAGLCANVAEQLLNAICISALHWTGIFGGGLTSILPRQLAKPHHYNRVAPLSSHLLAPLNRALEIAVLSLQCRFASSMG